MGHFSQVPFLIKYALAVSVAAVAGVAAVTSVVRAYCPIVLCLSWIVGWVIILGQDVAVVEQGVRRLCWLLVNRSQKGPKKLGPFWDGKVPAHRQVWCQFKPKASVAVRGGSMSGCLSFFSKTTPRHVCGQLCRRNDSSW